MRQSEPAGIARRVAESMIDDVAAAVSRWRVHAGEAGVGQSGVKTIEAVLAAGLALR